MNEIKIQANKNRKTILKMIYHANAGHPGGSLSVIDMLTAVYEEYVDFGSKPRAKVILSKGHASPALYACLHGKGKISDEELLTFRRIDSRLQGHPHSLSIPEIDATTGLLGQGLSIGIGVALAKRNNKDDSKVFVFAGDGELHEGQIWESTLIAAHYKLENLVLIVDYNKLSSSGDVNQVTNLEPLEEKFKVFNWNTLEIDGHDFDDIKLMMDAINKNTGKPLAIIANTVKGKCISFMENEAGWHSGALTDEQYKKCLEELGVDDNE